MTDTARPTTLAALFARAVQRRPAHVAVEDPPDAALSYADLDRLASRAAAWLAGQGVQRGDRVGIYLPKSADAVAALHGAMRVSAAYVPVDAHGPASRAATILADCAAGAVIVERSLREALVAALTERGAPVAPLLVLEGTGGGRPLADALDAAGVAADPPAPERGPGARDLAYILYTSGSTGKPKGVMLTHENALAFVGWCADTFAPRADDRFSSHAPFHFDLSVLDLYLPLWEAATLVLIGAEQGKEPRGLADLIAARRLTVWYSTPSILSLLAQFGKLERHAYDHLRLVLFAGEVFPVKFLRLVKSLLPGAYANLYGPTETNVCTWHPIPEVVPHDRTEPYPIGAVCGHLRGRVVDPEGRVVATGEPGELLIAGGNVMQGYWNLPERTAECFVTDPDGTRWYRTGDIVQDAGEGVFTFLGRRDRMVKRRGFRIELGEIEAALYRHPDVREAAVVALPDDASGVRIVAHLATRADAVLTTIALKRYCAGALPASMMPDAFLLHAALPKTSTDKIDYQQLKAHA